MTKKERYAYFSVDIEAAGPAPPYSMLSIGAVYTGTPPAEFYSELKPISEEFDPKALEANGFDLSKLKVTGQEPEAAMRSFSEWVKEISYGKRPVFVSYGTFDWMFVQFYLSKYTGEILFGPNGLDLKSFSMGVLHLQTWRETTEQKVMDLIGLKRDPSSVEHNALDDARKQARLFNLLQEIRSRHDRTKLKV